MIMDPDSRSSGNHPGIIDYKGSSYVFGFNYTLNFALTDVHHERRSVTLAKFSYNPDGTISTLPWWRKEGVPQVGTLNPFVRVEAKPWHGNPDRPQEFGQPVSELHRTIRSACTSPISGLERNERV